MYNRTSKQIVSLSLPSKCPDFSTFYIQLATLSPRTRFCKKKIAQFWTKKWPFFGPLNPQKLAEHKGSVRGPMITAWRTHVQHPQSIPWLSQSLKKKRKGEFHDFIYAGHWWKQGSRVKSGAGVHFFFSKTCNQVHVTPYVYDPPLNIKKAMYNRNINSSETQHSI